MAMKNENGFGSCYKLSGKRRKPYIARVTVGWDDKGVQKFKVLGYFKTKKEGIEALIEYHKNPYAEVHKDLTFDELYQMFMQEKEKTLAPRNATTYASAYKHIAPLYKMKFKDIKATHIQQFLFSLDISHSYKKKIKSIISQMYDFAMSNDIVDKDYSEYVTIGANDSVSTRQPFSEEEIQKLFEVVDKEDYVDTVLIMIYMGWRVTEMLELKTENVNLEDRYIKGGKKTVAGTDRIVPISNEIYKFIEKRYNPDSEYLITTPNGLAYSYNNYKVYVFDKLMNKYNMEHKTHDCRHTFATLLSRKGASEINIQKLMGHTDFKIDKDVYIHKDLNDLKSAIELL